MTTAYENGQLPASLMTKRELIAMQCLSGLCADLEVWQGNKKSHDERAAAAISQADSLLKLMAPRSLS